MNRAKGCPIDQRTFHGEITPQDFADALLAKFNQGGMRAQQRGRGNSLVVQIGTAQRRRSGGSTAMTVHLSEVEDGVHVKLGEQQWLGLAASLGQTALMTLLRPTSLLGRLDDVAQDISSLTLADRVMDTLKDTAAALGASYEITLRLRRLTCPYCGTANPVGDPSCVACGGPLGYRQPIACNNCGFVSEVGTKLCPNCGDPLESI
ncbi:MAG: zinc ribbon domain-containing protein [Anaerolineales bacterium]